MTDGGGWRMADGGVMRARGLFPFVVALTCGAMATVTPRVAAGLDRDEQAGRDLYERGQAKMDGDEPGAGPTATAGAGSASALPGTGPVAATPGQGSATVLSARLGGDGGWVLRAAAVACANCHGLGADGGGEGPQRAPGLRWPEWSSLEPALRRTARARLRAAVREGQGQDRSLSTAMPRFDLDDATLERLASHIERLATAAPIAALPRLALLRLSDGQVPTLERDVDQQLRACLAQRLRGRVHWEVAEATTPELAARQWRAWQQRDEILAVVAPPWRGWRPIPVGPESASLPALFPLVADPDPGAGDARWLLGGAEARAVALVQGWLQQQGAAEGAVALAVWTGRREADDGRPLAGIEVPAKLKRMAQNILQNTGRAITWERLDQPQLPEGRAGLWLDSTTLPVAGWWLVATAPANMGSPDPVVGRWWMALPYPGATPQPLGRLWAQAACRTVQAVLDDGTVRTRAQWRSAVGRLGRLRQASGWEWSLVPGDDDGYGASLDWTLVELGAGRSLRPVRPLMTVGRPQVTGPEPASIRP